MLMTSALLFIAMREIWKWNIVACVAVASLFFIVDASFFASNMMKLLEGGYVPLLLAGAVYLVMFVWHKGITAVAMRLGENPVPVETFFKEIADEGVARVPGTAVFLTRAKNNTPPVMMWYVKHSRALHQRVLAVTLDVASIPHIPVQKRLTMTEVCPNYWAITACYGFMQRPDLPALMSQIVKHGCTMDSSELTYFIGMEKIIPRGDRRGLPRWLSRFFGVLLRNSVRVTEYLHVPPEQVVDIGRQVSI
jgi:KUP system potassium uptake protein